VPRLCGLVQGSDKSGARRKQTFIVDSIFWHIK
jgi:hypothetical protein